MTILTSPYPTSDQGSVSLEPVFASEIVNVSEKLAQSRLDCNANRMST